MAVALHQVEPGFGRAMLARGELVAADSEAAVRAGADADVVAVAPVCEIVARFLAGPREVGDLVVRKARGAEARDGGLVERRGMLLVQHLEIAARDRLLELGAGLDG